MKVVIEKKNWTIILLISCILFFVISIIPRFIFIVQISQLLMGLLLILIGLSLIIKVFTKQKKKLKLKNYAIFIPFDIDRLLLDARYSPC